MAEKYEWKKAEKSFYSPGRSPQLVEIPAFKFFTLAGKGNPNDAFFKEYIQCLYSLSYALKMLNLMIRQPDFVTMEYADEIIEKVKIKKPHPLLENVKFETIKDGLCVQMLHIGSYDSEPMSFSEMSSFAHKNNLSRISTVHREIYLSDARKVQPEKLKTILRFQVSS